MSSRDRIYWVNEPAKWSALQSAGESNLTVAVHQLKRIGYTKDDIDGVVKAIMDKVYRNG